MRLCGYCGYAVNTSTTQVQPEGWDYQSPRALSALQDNTASLFTRFITGFARKLWRQILSNGGTKQLPHSWEVSQFVASGCFHQKRWWFVSGLQGAILPAPLQNLLFPEPRKLLARSASSSTTSLTTWGSLPVPGIEQDCMASHGWKDNASSQETWEFSLRSILAALDALGLLYLSCQPWFLQLLQKVHQVLPPDSLLLTVLHLQSPVSCFYFFSPPPCSSSHLPQNSLLFIDRDMIGYQLSCINCLRTRATRLAQTGFVCSLVCFLSRGAGMHCEKDPTKNTSLSHLVPSCCCISICCVFFKKEIHCPNMFHSTDVLSSVTQTLFSLKNTHSRFVILVPQCNKIKTHIARLNETQMCTQRLCP